MRLEISATVRLIMVVVEEKARAVLLGTVAAVAQEVGVQDRVEVGAPLAHRGPVHKDSMTIKYRREEVGPLH